MKRTQIYITEDQDRLLESRARSLGVSKAEVIRTLLDVGLGTVDADDAREQALDVSFGAMADAPDWETWLDGVRSGRGADARLRALASEEHGDWKS